MRAGALPPACVPRPAGPGLRAREQERRRGNAGGERPCAALPTGGVTRGQFRVATASAVTVGRPGRTCGVGADGFTGFLPTGGMGENLA